jgi:hypothetical protein
LRRKVDRGVRQRAGGLEAELVAVVDVLAAADEQFVDGPLAVEGEVPQQVVLCLGAEEGNVGRESGVVASSRARRSTASAWSAARA